MFLFDNQLITGDNTPHPADTEGSDYPDDWKTKGPVRGGWGEAGNEREEVDTSGVEKRMQS